MRFKTLYTWDCSHCNYGTNSIGDALGHDCEGKRKHKLMRDKQRQEQKAGFTAIELVITIAALIVTCAVATFIVTAGWLLIKLLMKHAG